MSYPPPTPPSNDNDADTSQNIVPPLPYAPPPPRTVADQPVTPSGDATAPPPDYAYRSPVAGIAAALANENPHPIRYLAGAALGLVVGLIGAWIYSKFVYYVHFELALLTSLIGYGVGFAVVIGSGRGGLIPAIIGAVISLFSILSSTVMLVNAALSEKMHMTVFLPLNAETLPLIFSDMNFLSILIIGIGVYGGFMTPYRAGQKPAAPPQPDAQG